MYDAYLAGLAKVKGADIASNELKFLTDVMNGQDLSLADFIEEGRHLKGAVSYRLYDEEETYNEKWHVDVKQLYDKLKSLPMDALSALSVRVQLFWFEGSSPVKYYGDIERTFEQSVGEQEAATTAALEEYFDQKFGSSRDPNWVNYLVDSFKKYNVMKSPATLVRIVFDYLKAHHAEQATDLWMTSGAA